MLAVVEPATGADLGRLEPELDGFLRERIAGYKMPRRWVFAPVPRLPSGKLLRRGLPDIIV